MYYCIVLFGIIVLFGGNEGSEGSEGKNVKVPVRGRDYRGVLHFCLHSLHPSYPSYPSSDSAYPRVTEPK